MRLSLTLLLPLLPCVLAGCTLSGGAGTSPPSLVTTALLPGSSGPVIQRPRGWTLIYADDAGSVASFVAFLTNNGRAALCRPSIPSCVPFRRAIVPGEVVVSWFEGDGGGVDVPAPDRSLLPLRISGAPARINLIHHPPYPGVCPQGASDAVTAAIVDTSGPPGSSWLIVACLRGPHLALLRQQVLAMVHSFRWH